MCPSMKWVEMEGDALLAGSDVMKVNEVETQEWGNAREYSTSDNDVWNEEW